MREAARADLAAVLSLYREAGLDSETDFDLEGASVIWEKLASYPFYKVFVAEQDSRAVGTYALLIMDNLAHKGARSAVVEAVAVRPSCQGQGIGKAMMRHAMDVCRQNGCYKVALSSNQKREDAHRFYEKLGFERHGFSFRIELPREG